jgi:type IV pilus assembly protein PilM
VPDEQSIWKKEISFSRKRKAGPAPDAAPVVDEAPVGETSVWKKELSLSRKRKPSPTPEAAPVVDKAPSGATSVWKKELSLSRKRKPSPAPEAAPVVDEAPAGETSVWKKEISFRRKRPDLQQPAVEAALVQESEPTPELEEVVPAPAVVTAEAVVYEPEVAPPSPEPVAEAPVPAPEATPPEPVVEAFEPAAPPTPSEPVAQAPAEPWEAEPTLPPEPAAPLAAPATAYEAAAPPAPAEPVSVAPEEPWEAEPTLPPEAVAPVLAEPEPDPDPMPEPTASAEPDEKRSDPWWKREVGRSRSKPLPEDDDEPATPFWRRDVKLGRNRAAKATPEPVVEQSAERVAAAAKKQPFWKKELSLGRKPKQASVERPSPEPAVVAAAAVVSSKKQPFWKKELSLGRKPKRAAVEQPSKERAPRSSRLRAPKLALPSLPSLGARKPASSKQDARIKRLVGLKIGASQIAAARIANNGAAELLSVARQPLEQGIVVGGELRDPDTLAEQLKLFFARNKLPRTNVRLGIASNRIGVRIFDLPGVDGDKALANAVQFRAQETLPIPLDEAVLDYHVIGESVDAEGNPAKRVLLVVAYRDLVERYTAACRKAGISLVGIDLEAFALLRALSAPRTDDAAPSALVAVAIGHERSTFAVSDGRVCEFTRVLEWGGAHLSVGIARALDRAPSEVEAIKRGLSLEAGAEPPEGLSVELNERAVDAVRKQVQTFARELVSSLQFYQNQPGSLGIGEIVLTGGTAHLPGLAQELQQLIGVTVRVGDPLARLKLGKKLLPPEQLGSYTVAIGLGIED